MTKEVIKKEYIFTGMEVTTKEEALRLHPSLEDYFLAKVRDKKGTVIL